MQNRVQLSQENPLWISWHDTNWIPILNASNVMDYFSEKSNPFYDHTCNNAIVRMQRQSMEQLNNMVGVEYILLHAQDPILYVVRKQHRHSPTEVTPLANYYIIAGIVYQAPDLANVFNSRILSTVHQLQTAFEEASSYSRYNPNKGYSWDFSSNKALSEKERNKNKKEDKTKEEPSSLFQRQRVDMLLGELMKKFAFPLIPQVMQIQQQQQQNATKTSNSESENQTEANETANMNGNSESGQDPKSDMKPPPEKKMKL